MRGWSLTVAGTTENERLLAEELNTAGGNAAVTDVHAKFAPLNADVVAACNSTGFPGALKDVTGSMKRHVRPSRRPWHP
jgi:hypothetical protein